ncbi:hypothetical protein [Nocardioides jiangxiensis]|uniref:PH domain-containing protein n=1 Tax=Nocardioides jiangxiensis TaxID=3064524 RepID=A0ABT9B1T2_9ACTN|nr:hypothetical protein [Nocardioides sp. WY-20]MDO7868335.1 hypothetical protein [Nocardioides sp. WY-20]
MPQDYRLAPQFAARLLGLTLMGAGLAIVVATVVAVGFITQPVIVSVTVGLALVAILWVIWKLRSGTWVVRLTDDGYKVQFVRGAGVKQARWADVADAVTTEVAGSPCVVLRLKNGGSTTIPVELVAADRDTFVRAIHEQLLKHGKAR